MGRIPWGTSFSYHKVVYSRLGFKLGPKLIFIVKEGYRNISSAYPGRQAKPALEAFPLLVIGWVSYCLPLWLGRAMDVILHGFVS